MKIEISHKLHNTLHNSPTVVYIEYLSKWNDNLLVTGEVRSNKVVQQSNETSPANGRKF